MYSVKMAWKHVCSMAAHDVCSQLHWLLWTGNFCESKTHSTTSVAQFTNKFTVFHLFVNPIPFVLSGIAVLFCATLLAIFWLCCYCEMLLVENLRSLISALMFLPFFFSSEFKVFVALKLDALKLDFYVIQVAYIILVNSSNSNSNLSAISTERWTG